MLNDTQPLCIGTNICKQSFSFTNKNKPTCRGNSGVDPGDTVTWNIQSGSGVAAIVAIADKFASTPTAPDLFAPDDPAPWPQSDSSTWRGTVNANMTSGQSESYYIRWTPSDGTPDRVFDPIIRVK